MKLIRISPERDYLLMPDLIWDGVSDGLTGGLAVYISRGIISRLIPVGTLCENTLDNLELVNLKGLTLMPGLVDCHVHLAMNGVNLFQAIDDWEKRPGSVIEKAFHAAWDYLANGVLAVRDGSDKINIGLQVRDAIRNEETPGPAVVACGRAVYKKGMYGSFLGPGVRSVRDAPEQVEVLHAEGIDQLKVVVSGLVSFKEFGVVGPVQFTTPDLRAIIDKAHGLGLKVMAHASSGQAVATAVRAGVDSVEHGYFMASAQLALMAAAGTAWVPTLAPLGNLIFRNHLPYEGADMDVIRKSFDLQLARVAEAHARGVLLGIGTDAGANHVEHGFSYHDELRYFSMAGLDNLAVLRLAAGNSADIIGKGHEMGGICPGKKPYLIAVPGDPLKSLDVLRKPELAVIPSFH